MGRSWTNWGRGTVRFHGERSSFGEYTTGADVGRGRGCAGCGSGAGVGSSAAA